MTALFNWENYALTHASSEEKNLFSAYSQSQCCQLVPTGCSRLLKTDLFNEGIATSRNILANVGGEVLGVDVSKTVCRKAHLKNKDVIVVQASIQNLPFQPGVFDGILDLSTIDHVTQDGAAEALNEYSFVLKQHSYLIVYYAQETFCGKQFWRGSEGVYLQNPKLMLENLQNGSWTLLVDKGFDLLSTFSLVPPLNWLRRLLWHLPLKFQKTVLHASSILDSSRFSRYNRTRYAFRLHIAKKMVV